jgi:DNA mismatch repair protein MutL
MAGNIRIRAFHIKDNGDRSLLFASDGGRISSTFKQCFPSWEGVIEELSACESIHGRYDYQHCPAQTLQLSSEITVDGIMARPKAKSKCRFVFFVNRRAFESPKWQRGLMQFFRKLHIESVEMFVGLTVPTFWLDFNVTPDKRSIYIKHEIDIMEVLQAACQKLIHQTTHVGHLKPDSRERLFPSSESRAEPKYDPEFLSMGEAEAVELVREDIMCLRPLGQFNDGFIICSMEDKVRRQLFAVDQHAAEERIRFEEIAAKYSIESQSLLAPMRLNISAEQEEVLTKHSGTVAAAGFEVQQKDAQWQLHKVPCFHGATCSLEGIDI